MDALLVLLQAIQRKWVYLYPVFISGSGRALPTEFPRFQRVDNDYRDVFSYLNSDNRVMRLLQYPDVTKQLQNMNDQLERSQKALFEYLESKRSRFARFYFIGDEDLLEILGQSRNPEVIQLHLKKLFAGLHSVEFGSDRRIIAIRSSEKERVVLNRPVSVTEDVETWLRALENEVSSTLASMLKPCLEDPSLTKYPQQILGLAFNLNFTRNVEKHLESGQDLSTYQEELRRTLTQLTLALQSQDTEEFRVTDLKRKSLIFDVIHFIDVVDTLIASKVSRLDHWTWQKQLRFYMPSEKDKRPIIRMCDSSFEYTFEYQGNASRLVHTALTDKCYLTLTQAMSNGFGGNPYGPAVRNKIYFFHIHCIEIGYR